MAQRPPWMRYKSKQTHGVTDVIGDKSPPPDGRRFNATMLGLEIWHQLRFCRLLKGNGFVLKTCALRVQTLNECRSIGDFGCGQG